MQFPTLNYGLAHSDSLGNLKVNVIEFNSVIIYIHGNVILSFRIFSEKGLLHIEKEFPKLKFKGKGHEVSSPKMHDYNSTCTTFFSCVISFL